MPSTHDAVADARNADVQVWVDGTFHHRDDAVVSVFDSAFLCGDGIWEGLRLHHGRFAFLDRHLDRLFAGLRAVAIDPGMDRRDIAHLLHDVVDRNAMADDAHVRLMVSRGRKKTPSQHPSNLVAGPTIVVTAEHKRADPEVAAAGITLFTASVRRPPPDTLDQRLNSHSKLHEVVALVQAVAAGADEALMLDTAGHVATCNATNFFAVLGDEVVTSTATSSLPGITRAAVLEVADEVGVRATARPFTLADVHGATEAFVTGTFGGLTPVREVDGRVLGTPGGPPGAVPGPVTRRLAEGYAERVRRSVTTDPYPVERRAGESP